MGEGFCVGMEIGPEKNRPLTGCSYEDKERWRGYWGVNCVGGDLLLACKTLVMERRRFIRNIGLTAGAGIVIPSVALSMGRGYYIGQPTDTEKIMVKLLTDGVETDYPGYKPQTLEREVYFTSDEKGSRIENAQDIAFPECTGGHTKINGFAICSGYGTPLYVGNIGYNQSVEIYSGLQVFFAKGAIVITM